MLNRLLAHVALLAVAADHFGIPPLYSRLTPEALSDIRLLAEDLKMPPVKLSHYFKELGCVVSVIKPSSSGTSAGASGGVPPDGTLATAAAIASYSAVLKAPLTFPKPKFGGASRR
jgi:hypothetical protein